MRIDKEKRTLFEVRSLHPATAPPPVQWIRPLQYERLEHTTTVQPYVTLAHIRPTLHWRNAADGSS